MSEESEITVTPTGDTAPAVKEEEQVINKPEGEQPADAASDPAQPKEPKKVDPRQKKIAELSYQTREQRRQIDQLLGMVEKTISQPRQADGTSPPKLEDFQTIQEFVLALYDYRENAKAAKQAPSKDQPDQHYIKYVSEKRDDVMSTGSEKYEDFEEVVLSDKNLTPSLRDAVFVLDDTEIEAEVFYYLGKNPKELARLSKLSPGRQIAEIGKLEAKLSNEPPPTKRLPAAPAPIAPVGGSSTNSTTITGNESMKDFIAKRSKQLGRK